MAQLQQMREQAEKAREEALKPRRPKPKGGSA
jgi:hypothetical protein